jgi:hypothetical protein
VRCADGSEPEVDRDCVAVQKSRSPIDAWPEAFIFFDRVLGLLRGLTASMEVKQVHTKGTGPSPPPPNRTEPHAMVFLSNINLTSPSDPCLSSASPTSK